MKAKETGDQSRFMGLMVCGGLYVYVAYTSGCSKAVNADVATGQAPPSLVEGPPAGVEYFASEAEGEKVELRCRATGIPAPESVVAYIYCCFVSLHIAAQAPLFHISGLRRYANQPLTFTFSLPKSQTTQNKSD